MAAPPRSEENLLLSSPHVLLPDSATVMSTL
jgi:hypothetical protein